MTNLANSPIYLEDIPKERVVAPERLPAHKRKRTRTLSLSQEDQQIVLALNTVKRDIEYLHNRYDQTTDPLLVDSIIYELKAAHIKYKYYLHLCKEKGIVGGV